MNIAYFFRYTLLFVAAFAGFAIQAQPQDSLLTPLQANDREQNRVIKEINKHYTEMLLRQWWNLPTDREADRRQMGLYSRYRRSLLAIGGESFLLPNDNRSVQRMTTGRVLPDQNVVALGWHPYWIGENTGVDTYKEYSFALLSHVAYYSYEMNPYTGGYRNFDAIYNFKYSDFIPTAHLDTCDVLLSVSCRGEDAAIFFTGEAIAQQNLIDSLISIVKEADADGIEISFEDVPRAQKAEFIDFVKNLSYELRETNSSYTIMMSIPVYDKDNVYDLEELRPWVDYFIISAFNHHVTPLGLVRGAIAPLRNAEAPVRGTTVAYTAYLTLDSLARLPLDMRIEAMSLAHDKEYTEELLDTLSFYFARLGNQLNYQRRIEDYVTVLRNPASAAIRNNLDVRRWLSKTTTIVELRDSIAPTEKLPFFLFQPEYSPAYILEYEQYAKLSTEKRHQSVGYVVRDAFNKLVHAPSASVRGDSMYDLRKTIEECIEEIGEDYKSSLVLGLPYHGAVWNMRGEKPTFEGYVPYGQIRKLIVEQGGELIYDKYYTSMILRLSDSLGIVREIYFDNSATIEQKIEHALDAGLAGVGVWALGYDYGYPDLWKLFEQSFVMPRFFNPESNKFEKIKLKPSNKVAFTIQYQIKRLSRIIFATFFLVAILMTFGFNIVLLDWKVRDVLFYTGSFRIFYLTLFSMLILFVGSSVGIFQNPWVAFLVGTLLGLTLTWIATILTQKQQARIP